MGNACFKPIIHKEKILSNNSTCEAQKDGISFISFLQSSWPGSILDWTQHDLEMFAECFWPHDVKAGEEVCGIISESLFVLKKKAPSPHL